MQRMAQMECGANDKLNEWGVWLITCVCTLSLVRESHGARWVGDGCGVNGRAWCASVGVWVGDGGGVNASSKVRNCGASGIALVRYR